MSSIVSLGNHKIVARLLQNAKKIPVWKLELVKVTLDVKHKQWHPNMYLWHSVLNETKTGIYLIVVCVNFIPKIPVTWERGRCQPPVKTNLSLCVNPASCDLDLDLKLITGKISDNSRRFAVAVLGWASRQTSFHLPRIMCISTNLTQVGKYQIWNTKVFVDNDTKYKSQSITQKPDKSQWITGSEHKSEKFQHDNSTTSQCPDVRQGHHRPMFDA